MNTDDRQKLRSYANRVRTRRTTGREDVEEVQPAKSPRPQGCDFCQRVRSSLSRFLRRKGTP